MTQTDQVRAAVDPETGLPIRAVCVIDTGIDANHEDLPRVNVEGRSFGLNVGGWNSSMDGHGTHVAGTAVALAGRGWGSSPAGGTGIGSAVRGVEGGGKGLFYLFIWFASKKKDRAGARPISLRIFRPRGRFISYL